MKFEPIKYHELLENPSVVINRATDVNYALENVEIELPDGTVTSLSRLSHASGPCGCAAPRTHRVCFGPMAREACEFCCRLAIMYTYWQAES